MAKDIIEIEFKPKGDRSLIDAIEKLDKATKSLVNVQAKLVNQNNSNVNSLTKLSKSLRENGMSFKKLNINVNTIKKAYSGNAIAIQKLKIAYERYNKTLKKTTIQEQKTNHRTRILGGTIAVLRSKILLFNFAIGFAIRALGKFASSASQVVAMERAFNTLSGGILVSENALKKLQEATNGTMSEFDLFQQANNAMILGVTKNSDEMAEMFDMAQRLGKALGKDTASSVESLVTGIGRQSRLMLDNIGIIVDSTKAYKDYASANNLSADSLSDVQKKQAFLNATLDSARKKLSTMNEETEDSQNSFARLTAETSNLSSAIGQRLSPALASVSEKLASHFKFLTGLIEPTTKLEQTQKKLATQEKFLAHFLEAKNKGSEQQQQGIAISIGLTKKRIAQLKEELRLEESLVERRKESGQEGLSLEEKQAMSNGRLLAFLATRNELEKNGLTFDEKKILLNQQKQLSEQDLNAGLITSFDNAKKILEISRQEIKLEEEIKNAKLQSASAIVGAMASLNTVAKGNAKVSKALAITQAVIDTYAGANKAFAQGGVLGFVTGSAIIAQGLANVAQMESQKLSSFEDGGLVGGRRHSQGGTVIEAERGEFVMSRSAVQSIGVETLNQMNKGGGSGITLNISAPLVDETIVDTIIPAIQKAQRMNLA